VTPDEVAEIVGRTGLERRTARTITTLPALQRELADIQERGYALDEEENEANIRCLAAPLRGADGRTIGAVGISTITFVVPPRSCSDSFPR
jgi:IclR family transcriptional regulator, acetate operon repressor